MEEAHWCNNQVVNELPVDAICRFQAKTWHLQHVEELRKQLNSTYGGKHFLQFGSIEQRGAHSSRRASDGTPPACGSATPKNGKALACAIIEAQARFLVAKQ